MWVLERCFTENIDSNEKKKFITNCVLYQQSYYSSYKSCSNSKDFLNFTKMLKNKGYLLDDLTVFNNIPNILIHVEDIDYLDWFNENFTIDWSQQNLLTNKLGYCIEGKLINWYIEKVPSYISNGEIDKFLSTCMDSTFLLRRGYFYIFSRFDRKECLKKFWYNFIKSFFGQNTRDQGYLKKCVFIFGLVMEEIKDVPLGIVRFINLKKSDVENFVKNNIPIHSCISRKQINWMDNPLNFKHPETGELTSEYLFFPEDYPDNNGLKHDYGSAMNKQECQESLDEIMDYLESDVWKMDKSKFINPSF